METNGLALKKKNVFYLLTKIKTTNKCFLTAKNVLVIKNEKQNNNKNRKKNQRKNKQIKN